MLVPLEKEQQKANWFVFRKQIQQQKSRNPGSLSEENSKAPGSEVARLANARVGRRSDQAGGTSPSVGLLVAPNAYQAACVAEFHDMDQVALTQGGVANICAGSQSATHAMGMMGVSSIPMDDRTQVGTGWGIIRNEHLELNAGFPDDPGTSAYEQVRGICYSKDVAVRRLNALFVSLDCRPNCMESQRKGKYRDKQNKPLPGVDGDLARSCDDQLLDGILAIKRIADERELLIERRDREREREELENAYDASTDDEAKE